MLEGLGARGAVLLLSWMSAVFPGFANRKTQMLMLHRFEAQKELLANWFGVVRVRLLHAIVLNKPRGVLGVYCCHHKLYDYDWSAYTIETKEWSESYSV